MQRLMMAACGLMVSLAINSSQGQETEKFFDDGQLALFATNPAGVVEPAVPLSHNSEPVGTTGFRVVEAFDNVPGTGSFPLTFVDLISNMFLRATYQNADGTTGALGTSVVGTVSYRNEAGQLQFVPAVNQASVVTDGAARYESLLQGSFGGEASVASRRNFPDPALGETIVGLATAFNALADINLAIGEPFSGNDRFRLLTVSSMFADESQFDADIIRYETQDGQIKTIFLTDSTTRDSHLLPSPDAIGTWLEVIKSPQSTWFPDSPTTRIDIVDKGGLTLGLQGFLAGSTDPNDDSLSVWLEWLDAPDTVSNGTTINAEFTVTAKTAEFWQLRWPNEDSIWMRDSTNSEFVSADENCSWNYRLTGTASRGIISGFVRCSSSSIPLFGLARIKDGKLSGFLLRFDVPQFIRLKGSRIQ